MPAFTTIAAGVGLASTVATTAMSFKQASDQNKAMLRAQDEADKAMAEARKKLDVNFYESLSIPKEAYAQQVQANLSAGAQTLQAASEGESRGVGAVAGLVQAQQNQAQNEIRANMGQDIYNLQAATAQEDARLRDIGIQLDLGEIEGAQLAAANAGEMSAQAMQQGMQGVTSTVGQLATMAPLFDKSNLRQNEKLNEQYNKSKLIKTAQEADIPGIPSVSKTPTAPMGTYQQEIAKLGTVNGINFSGVDKLKPEEFNSFMSELDVRTLRELNRSNPFIQY